MFPRATLALAALLFVSAAGAFARSGGATFPGRNGRRCRVLVWVFVATAVIVAGAGAATRVVAFQSLGRSGVPSRAIPRHLRSAARKLPLPSDLYVWLAPTPNGNFCEGFSFGFGGCRGRTAPTWMSESQREAFRIGDTVEHRNSGVVAIAGDLLAPPGSSLSIVYADRSQERVAVTYVSAPISAGFFAVSFPRGARHPLRLIATSPYGKKLASVAITAHP